MDLVCSRESSLSRCNLSVRWIHLRYRRPKMGRHDRCFLPHPRHDHLFDGAYHEHLHRRHGVLWCRCRHQRTNGSSCHIRACAYESARQVCRHTCLHYHPVLSVSIVGSAHRFHIDGCMALDWPVVWSVGFHRSGLDGSFLPPTSTG